MRSSNSRRYIFLLMVMIKNYDVIMNDHAYHNDNDNDNEFK